ncbi:hypothetical protein MY10362_002925 [Beauveria mimosiformis]
MSSTEQDVDTAEQNIGAVINLVPPSEGSTVWQATQVQLAKNLPPPGKSPNSRREFSWSFGPAKLTGYVDTDTWEIGVEVSVLGISLGKVYGNLKEGVVIKVNLFLAKGSIKLYLKNGNELWVRLDLDVKFDGGFHSDYKIIAF